MKKYLILGLFAGPGCMHFQPIGPLADMQSLPAKAASATPLANVDPIVRDAPRPTPPAVYITPSEVTTDNAVEALKRLTQELETDRRSMDAMPRYAEISSVK